MKRKIINIDEERCDGCGLCVTACHEGAISLVDGKARLLRDDYCDGLGDCLPACPQEAITFVEREAAAYDEEAVRANMQKRENGAADAGNSSGSGSRSSSGSGPETAGVMAKSDDIAGSIPGTLPCGCPGTLARSFDRDEGMGAVLANCASTQAQTQAQSPTGPGTIPSQLRQWPAQIKLVPPKAPYFENANLLIAADCTAYAYGGFHTEYMKNRITLIGCPKLDEGDYSEKLTAILRENEIKSVTVARMEVPCCGGLENAVKAALKNCGKMIPWQIVVVSTDGRILED